MAYTPDEDLPEPPHLRRLRRMVMALLVVLMLGILAIAGTIVIRLGFLGGSAGPEPVRAGEIVLPAGLDLIATGQGKGTVLFAARAPDGAEFLLVVDSATGRELSRTPIRRE